MLVAGAEPATRCPVGPSCIITRYPALGPGAYGERCYRHILCQDLTLKDARHPVPRTHSGKCYRHILCQELTLEDARHPVPRTHSVAYPRSLEAETVAICHINMHLK